MAVSNAIEVDGPNVSSKVRINELQQRIATAYELIGVASGGTDALETCFIEGVHWILKDVPEGLYEVMGDAQLEYAETADLNGLLAYLLRIIAAGDPVHADEQRLIRDVLTRAYDFVCCANFPSVAIATHRHARAARIAEGLNA